MNIISKIPTIFKERRVILKEENKEKRQESFLKVDELANARGVTFYAIAKALNFAPTVFSDWKSGKSMPKTDKLLKIADYFGVDVSYFVG